MGCRARDGGVETRDDRGRKMESWGRGGAGEGGGGGGGEEGTEVNDARGKEETRERRGAERELVEREVGGGGGGGERERKRER